ncbi:MAG: PilN domain-containing protein, partial [Zoogloeaceae bacterium]|nr:PilN domain-containing protein [Zoogloeaceae bacterium]
VLVHGVIAGYISQQERKNEFLKKEIAALDKEIDEIKRLKEQTSAMLARKGVIESLQGSRAETVRLFNELARQVPAGIYLKSLKQAGNRIGIVGIAQSNARVSTLMRNLEASPLLERPDLIEIKAVTMGNRRYAEFKLNVIITREAAEAADRRQLPGRRSPMQDKKA